MSFVCLQPLGVDCRNVILGPHMLSFWGLQTIWQAGRKLVTHSAQS